jgi:uncharacterized protein YcfJ
MSIMVAKKKFMVSVVAASVAALAGASAFAGDRHDHRYDGRYDARYDQVRYDDAYDYAKVVDVQPLITRVRVNTPQRECWDETRVEGGGYRNGPLPRSNAGATLLGAAIGAALGNQIGSGSGRRAATVGGAVIGAAIGRDQAEKRNAQYGSVGPTREYTVERCETRYREEWQERVDGYRVTYIYNGRRQVTEMPYDPGDRIRVRVDVSPAE